MQLAGEGGEGEGGGSVEHEHEVGHFWRDRPRHIANCVGLQRGEGGQEEGDIGAGGAQGVQPQGGEARVGERDGVTGEGDREGDERGAGLQEGGEVGGLDGEVGEHQLLQRGVEEGRHGDGVGEGTLLPAEEAQGLEVVQAGGEGEQQLGGDDHGLGRQGGDVVRVAHLELLKQAQARGCGGGGGWEKEGSRKKGGRRIGEEVQMEWQGRRPGGSKCEREEGKE